MFFTGSNTKKQYSQGTNEIWCSSSNVVSLSKYHLQEISGSTADLMLKKHVILMTFLWPWHFFPMFNYFAPPQEPKKIDKDKFQFHQHKKVKDLTKKVGEIRRIVHLGNFLLDYTLHACLQKAKVRFKFANVKNTSFVIEIVLDPLINLCMQWFYFSHFVSMDWQVIGLQPIRHSTMFRLHWCRTFQSLLCLATYLRWWRLHKHPGKWNYVWYLLVLREDWLVILTIQSSTSCHVNPPSPSLSQTSKDIHSR